MANQIVVGGRPVGWLIALLVLLVCVLLIVVLVTVTTFVLKPIVVLGLIGALALAMVLG